MKHHNLVILDSGHLPGGAPFQAVLLQPVHALAAARLHRETIAGLADDEKPFLLHKDRAYFAAHLARPCGNTVIGIVSNGQLIAQAMIVHPTHGNPATGMTDMAPVAPPHKVSIMQAVSVNPRFRGNGLMELMVKHWISHAAQHGRTDLLAEIDVRNAASWASFLRAGLNLVSIGHDKSDGTTLYNAHEKTALAAAKSLTPEFNRYAGHTVASCAVHDLLCQEYLMKAGYVITGRERDKQSLIMTKLSAPAR